MKKFKMKLCDQNCQASKMYGSYIYDNPQMTDPFAIYSSSDTPHKR